MPTSYTFYFLHIIKRTIKSDELCESAGARMQGLCSAIDRLSLISGEFSPLVLSVIKDKATQFQNYHLNHFFYRTIR